MPSVPTLHRALVCPGKLQMQTTLDLLISKTLLLPHARRCPPSVSLAWSKQMAARGPAAWASVTQADGQKQAFTSACYLSFFRRRVLALSRGL